MDSRIILFGDNYGLTLLIRHIPSHLIKGIIIASIRPQYFNFCEQLAAANNIKLLIQPVPNSVDYLGFIKEVRALSPDLYICASYSMILREDLLKIVNYNAINLHSALLPKNRGPNPIQWAIIKDEKQTGVTLHFMDEQVDHGDIIVQRKVTISDEDTWVSLREKITLASDQLCSEEFNKILRGPIKRQKQQDSESTINSRLTSASPRIDFRTMSDREIYNLIRAQVAPLKGAYLIYDGAEIRFNEYISYATISQLRKQYALEKNVSR